MQESVHYRSFWLCVTSLRIIISSPFVQFKETIFLMFTKMVKFTNEKTRQKTKEVEMMVGREGYNYALLTL